MVSVTMANIQDIKAMRGAIPKTDLLLEGVGLAIKVDAEDVKAESPMVTFRSPILGNV
ncbi:hypothetical protein DSCO28_38270 [Desulfosarcina ovata subsp. sediminis]|uniref:Uncharacterized protein n=1 Tax=Desulfosarcina ovata subsp. sediminis TaxID=885957 RepID=A0A5K7ZSS4_9BACT|nr:hypothetical protein DSCO28_38270 [Desulfosarcina ovata subsp. sediminis]